MNESMNKSVWSGVFFPSEEPQEMNLIEEDPMDAPLDTAEVVSTDFQVDREDISADTSVTNEVTDTPEIMDESPATEENVATGTTEEIALSDEPVTQDPAPEEPMLEENSVPQETVTEE